MRLKLTTKTSTLALLFAASIAFTGCNSSGDGASKNSNNNDNKVPGDLVLKDWDDIESDLDNTTGQVSIIKAKSYRDYLFSSVMEANRGTGESLYITELMDKIKQPKKNPVIDIRYHLFGDNHNDIIPSDEKDFFSKERYNTGFTRYKKQVKCMTDLHQRELEIMSLLAGAHDPLVRDGIFGEEYEDATEEELLDLLWQADGDLINLIKSYREKLIASYVAPFINDEDTLEYNLWSCNVSPASFTEAQDDENTNKFEFMADFVNHIANWRSGDSPVTRENMPEVLEELRQIANEAKALVGDDGELAEADNIGLMHKLIFDDFYVEPESNVWEVKHDDDTPYYNAAAEGLSSFDGNEMKFAQGTLDRLNKLACRGYLMDGSTGENITTKGVCAGTDQPKREDADEDYEGYIYPLFQIDRTLNEQLASNIEEMLRNSVYKVSLAESLLINELVFEQSGSSYKSRADGASGNERTVQDQFGSGYNAGIRNAVNGLMENIDKIRAVYIGAIMQRDSTDANSEYAMLVSNVYDDEDEGSATDVEDQRPIDPADDEHDNVLRKDRIQYRMDELETYYKENYIVALFDAEKAASSWNHLITLLLIAFGGLRLRSRRKH